MLGQPLLQELDNQELQMQIGKQLRHIVDNFQKLKREDIEWEITEVNNLFLRFIELQDNDEF